MSISQLGALGEFLGFFAVLATLIYLAIQTRQTSHIAAGNAVRAMTFEFQGLWNSLGMDEDYMKLVRRGMNDWESLSHNEQSRVHTVFINIALHLDGCLNQEHLAEARSVITGWENNFLGLILCPGGAIWWKTMNYMFNEGLRSRIESRLQDELSLPPPWIDTLPWWTLDEHDS